MDSLLAQTFRDYEILLVDDGSPDRSGEICDEYAKRDSRIRVFHKENGGVGSAREVGIIEAKGIYSIHVDSDDWVNEKMLEDMYRKMESEHIDILVADYFVCNRNGMKYIYQKPRKCDGLTLLQDIIKGTLMGTLWNKMIRLSLYNEYNIHFVENVNYAEDILVLAQLLKNPVTVGYINKGYYYYDFSNMSSITRRYDRKTYIEQCKFINCLNGLISSNEICLPTCNLMNNIKMRAFIHMSLTKNEYYEFNSISWRDIVLSNYNILFKIGLFMAQAGWWHLAQNWISLLLIFRRKLYGCAL